MIQHITLEARWGEFTLVMQMANIGAEVGRTINWRKKGNIPLSNNAFYRGLELLDFTIADPKNRERLSEILRVRECLVDYFFGDNTYKSTDRSWERYFNAFNRAVSFQR